MKILTDLEKTSSRSTGGLAEPSRCTQRHGVTLDTKVGVQVEKVSRVGEPAGVVAGGWDGRR